MASREAWKWSVVISGSSQWLSPTLMWCQWQSLNNMPSLLPLFSLFPPVPIHHLKLPGRVSPWLLCIRRTSMFTPWSHLWKLPESPVHGVLECWWFLCGGVGHLHQHPNTFGQLDSKAILLEPRVAQNISGIHLSVSFMTFLPKVSKPVQRTPGESKHCFTLILPTLLAHLLTKMFISSCPQSSPHTWISVNSYLGEGQEQSNCGKKK